MVRVVVAVAEKDEEVVLAGVLADVVDERRAGRSFSVEPIELVGERMRFVEDALGQASELERVALVLHAKAPHRDPVDLLDAGFELVAPRHVVGRAGGQHLDVGMARQALGDVTRVQLGAAVDRQAVALNDDREFHDS